MLDYDWNKHLIPKEKFIFNIKIIFLSFPCP